LRYRSCSSLLLLFLVLLLLHCLFNLMRVMRLPQSFEMLSLLKVLFSSTKVLFDVLGGLLGI
jgi:hypothetical protein